MSEKLDQNEVSILAYLNNKDPGRMSADRMMEIVQSLIPASNAWAPQDELVETILEAYRGWAEIDRLKAELSDYKHLAAEAFNERDALKASLSEAVEVIRPFAEEAPKHADTPQHWNPRYIGGIQEWRAEFTYGDLTRARTFIDKHKGE